MARTDSNDNKHLASFRCSFLSKRSQDFFLSSFACCMIPRPTITPSASTSAALRPSFVIAWTWRRYSCSTCLACARWVQVSTGIGRVKRRKNLFVVVKALKIVKILSDTTLGVVCTSITLRRIGRSILVDSFTHLLEVLPVGKASRASWEQVWDCRRINSVTDMNSHLLSKRSLTILCIGIDSSKSN